MAFGSSVSGGRERLAAKLKISVDTGQAKTEVKEFGSDFEAVMKGMTAEQIKANKAANQFQATLKRYGPEHDRTKQAALRLDAAERRLAASLERTEHQARRNQHAFDGTVRSMGRMTRGAIAGSGVFQALGRTMAFASAGFIGTTGFVYGAKAALNAASDLNEQITKTKEVFGASTGTVMEFADKALGLSKREALETSSTIGALLHAMGVLGPTATRASVDLTKLGVDLASFYNTSVQDSLAAIQSALVGQVRPLRRYGAEVSAAREKTVALAMTGKTSATELTRQERVLARLKIIFKDTGVAQGDYLRTSQGLANQQRTLGANIENMAARIGEELIPAAEDASRSLNKWLSNSENQERVQRDVNKAVHVGAGIVKGFAGAIRNANTVVGPLVEHLGGVEKVVTLAFGAAALLKVRRFFLGTQTAVHQTTVVVVRDAAKMEAALDTALRPRTLTVRGGGKGGLVGGFLAGAGLMAGGEAVGGSTGGYLSAGGEGALAGTMVSPGWGTVIGAALGVGIKAALQPNTLKQQVKAIWNKKTAAEQTAALMKLGGGARAEEFLKEYGLKWKGRVSGGPRPEEGRITSPGPPTPKKATAAQSRASRVKAAEARVKELEILAEKETRSESLTGDINVAKRIAAQKKIIADLKKDVDSRMDYERAISQVYQLEKQQADAADAAAKERTAERKRREAARIAREKEAARAYRATLASRETRLETAVDKAGTLKQLRKRRADLIAFLKAEANDKKLTEKERARYAKEVVKVEREGVEDELKLREQTLKRRLTKAKLTDTKSDDVAREKDLIAFYASAAKRAGQTVKEIRAWLDKKAAAQVALKALLKKDRKDTQDAQRTSAQSALDFLNTRSDFFSQFGPNVFTQQGSGPGGYLAPGSSGNTVGGAGGNSIVVNQNFTSQPDDAFRAAKMARFAYDTSFD